MPSIRKVEFQDSIPIADRLHGAAVDLLPERMADHELVHWILRHDGLLRKPLTESESQEYRANRRTTLGFITFAVAASLQTRIPFYFASLFHIARIEAVSAAATENIDALRLGSNLETSIIHLGDLKRVDEQGKAHPLGTDNAAHLLDGLVQASSRHYNLQKLKAEEWWRMWLQEIEALQYEVHAFEGEYHNSDGYKLSKDITEVATSLVARCSAPSALQASMVLDGVRFKQQGSENSGFALTNALPLLAAMLMAGREHISIHHLAERLFELIDRWLRNEEENKKQQGAYIALRLLQDKYGLLDPFVEFEGTKGPATPKLRELVIEHELPGLQPSPWLLHWHKSLLTTLSEYHQYYHRPFPKATVWMSESIDWMIRSADSSIKKNISEAIRPGETWNVFLQRLFEKRFVSVLGKMAGLTKDSVDEEPAWNTQEFHEYIEIITNGLNAFGYSLVPPSKQRLEKLLKKVRSGQYLEEDAW